VENREVTLGAFLDIMGAFDCILLDIIRKAAKWHGLGDMICQWIGCMLGGRKMTATLAGETLERSIVRCCPQGGVFCHLCWGGLVVDELVRGLKNNCCTMGCADDIAIVFSAEST
jgi:hypothetical protein